MLRQLQDTGVASQNPLQWDYGPAEAKDICDEKMVAAWVGQDHVASSGATWALSSRAIEGLLAGRPPQKNW